MIPAKTIHQWATQLPPSYAGGGVILAGVALACLIAVLRARSQLAGALPLLAFLALATIYSCAWVDAPYASLALGGGAVACLSVHLWLARSDEDAAPSAPSRAVAVSTAGEFSPSIEDPFRPMEIEPADKPLEGVSPVAPSLPLRLALFAGFVVTSVLLFDDLAGYAGTLLAWESPVVQHGFVAAFDEGIGFWRFLADRFLWDDGVLSAGHTSLFFGPPTYALFAGVSATTWTLRLVPAVSTLAAMAVLYSLVRRYFDVVTATAAAILFGLNTPVLLYGRYGSSIAGTLLAVLLAIYATWYFLERGRGVLGRALLCGAALFVATLQYAPARLAVVFLLGLIPFALLVERRGTSRRWAGAVLVALVAVGVWTFQVHNGRQDYFLHGRGEQVFGMFRHPNTIPALVGTDRKFSTGKMDRSQKLEVVRMVLQKTSQELIEFVTPQALQRGRGLVVEYDPPALTLYFAPVAVFALLGLARSLTFWRSWRYSAPLLFAVAYSTVLLFTNRIDSHRGVLLVIPLAIWFGLGIREVGSVGRRLRLPTALLAALALAFAASAVYADVHIRYPRERGLGRVLESLVAEVESIPGPVGMWVARDHREVAWLGLRMLDSRLHRDGPAGRILPQALTDGLRGDKGGPRSIAIRQAKRRARRATLLLGPRTMFLEAAQRLQSEGFRVAERNAAGYRYYRIDGGARRTGVSDSELPPATEIAAPPTPVPLVLSKGPRIYLSDLQPHDVEYGFAEPVMDKTWQGRPVQMGGVDYPKAIGTHAWTVMRFKVPKGAIALQAVVGVSDRVRSCDATSVQFEVLDSRGRMLWESDVFDFASKPEAIEIPIVNQTEITLLTSEAADGRDCDHANWGSAAFLFRDDASLEDFRVHRGQAGQ